MRWLAVEGRLMAGVFYTPAALLEALEPRSYDPSCGTG